MLLLAVVLMVLFLVLLVLGYRRHSRVSRNEANLRISRDRANFDLQMMAHQVQARVQVQSDDSASLSDSLPSKRSTRRKHQATSLPPGPPSSSNDQSVVEQAEEPALSAAPATWHANRFGAAANSGQAQVTPAPSAAAPTAWPFSSLRRASSSAAPKRSAQPESAFAPRAKRSFTFLESPRDVLPPEAPSASKSSVAPPPSGGEPKAVELETFLADEEVVLGSDLDMQSLQEDAGAQSSGSAPTAPASGLEEDFEPTAAELAAFLADEEVTREIQALPDLLGCPPARAGVSAAPVAPFCMPPRAAQQLSGNVPPWQGRKPPAAMTPR